jgi:ferritin-like metal-binding protein YciE
MTLHEMLVDEIKDLYHAEKQLTKALPKMAKAANHDDLREAFETHLDETKEHVARLEEVFEALGEKVKAKPCAGMAGIIEEGRQTMDEDLEGAVMDAALIAAAQRAEHYEIGAYGTCLEWARVLGLGQVVSLLETTLEDENAADKKLTALAKSEINRAAAEAQSEGEEEEQDTTGGRAARAASTGRRMSSTAQTRAKAADKRRR